MPRVYNTQAEKDKAQLEKLDLYRIAELYKEGRTQREIGEIIFCAQQTVSYRLSIIKEKYPFLLQ